MGLPLFFFDGSLDGVSEVQLDEVNARHIVQVLRMQEGALLRLTDGKGTEAVTTIVSTGKKKCSVSIDNLVVHELPGPGLHLAVAFTRNNSRNEWMLEKATELGVRSIIPLATKRSEKERLRPDRLKGILVSALLQSQQFHLPMLQEIADLKNAVSQFGQVPQKLMGHCMEGMPRLPVNKAMLPGMETAMLIGPEGDFTTEEAELCSAMGFQSITLGGTRLRTETAAITACAYFNLINT
jgi:16S rRNA (uracil1498-N3)-methyltransferase